MNALQQVKARHVSRGHVFMYYDYYIVYVMYCMDIICVYMMF